MNIGSIVALGDVCYIQSGGTPLRSKSEYYGGDIPWAKISDLNTTSSEVIDTEETITKAGLKAIQGRVFPKGALLFAIYGSIGKMAFAGREITTNQAILGIVPKVENVIDIRYLYHWLGSQVRRFTNDGQGVTQKNLSATYLRDLKVPCPPFHTQSRIAAILDKADAIRRKHEQALTLANNFLRSTFLEMFGDPIRNPKRWPLVNMRELIDLYGGYAFKSEDYTEDGVPLIRIGTANKNEFDLSGLAFLPQSFADEFPRFLVKPKDILITLTGTVGKEDYGNVSVVPDTYHVWLLNQRVGKISIKHDDLAQEFMVQLLKIPSVKSQIIKNQRGVRQANIKADDILGLKVPLPDYDLQSKFAGVVYTQRKITANMSSQLQASNAMMASLSQRAFRGEL